MVGRRGAGWGSQRWEGVVSEMTRFAVFWGSVEGREGSFQLAMGKGVGWVWAPTFEGCYRRDDAPGDSGGTNCMGNGERERKMSCSVRMKPIGLSNSLVKLSIQAI